MLDVKTLEWEQISRLAGMYTHTHFKMGTPFAASEKKQKKIRMWMVKHYASSITQFPSEIQACFAPERSDPELFAFLEACNQEVKWRIEEKCAERNRVLEDFNEEVRDAIEEIPSYDFWPRVEVRGNDCVIMVDDCPAFRRDLILENCSGVVPNAQGSWCDVELERIQDQRWCFKGIVEAEPINLTFENVCVRVECFNGMDDTLYWDSVWSYLDEVVGNLVRKLQIPGICGNAKERELLPVLQEIHNLNMYYQENSFPLLKEMAARHGNKKLEERLVQLENVPMGIKRRAVVNNLDTLLSMQSSEPIWREIFKQVAESQAEYPKKSEVYCEPLTVEKTRKAIQRFMEQEGFEGTYPDFVKKGSLRGVHMEESYGLSYFISTEKRMVSHVHCMEVCGTENQLGVHFLSGVEFLRKEETAADIYSCLFNAKGRKLFSMVRDQKFDCDPYAPATLGYNLRFARIAAKRAQLQKLTKAERALCSQPTGSLWQLFWIWLLLGGGMFGVCMTVGMMLISVILAALFGQAAQIPDMLAAVPWGWMLVFSWIGFGGAMGLLSVFVKRK